MDCFSLQVKLLGTWAFGSDKGSGSKYVRPGYGEQGNIEMGEISLHLKTQRAIILPRQKETPSWRPLRPGHTQEKNWMGVFVWEI